jgi:SAM-dependent methyltransferase
LERHRLLYLYLSRQTKLWDQPDFLLHFAPEDCLRKVLAKGKGARYITVDLATRNVSVQTDITRLAFRDAAFNPVICIHVLEHIPDDLQAMREIRRVLAPGGVAILQVPIDGRLSKTHEDPSVTSPAERRRHFGQEDHVRWYGVDFGDRLARAGFEATTYPAPGDFSPADLHRHGLKPDEVLHICRKPATP